MTMQELSLLLNHIKADHSFCRAEEGRSVKYIDPHIDTRTWTCFAITFRCSGNVEHHFHTQNECRDLPGSLYTRCMRWLDGLDAQTDEPKLQPSGD